VVAGGAAYLVNLESKTASNLAWPVEFLDYVASQNVMVMGNGLWFEAIGARGAVWRSRRISWDGMRSLQRHGDEIRGEAYSPMGPPDWLPFTLHLATGDVEGGSYNGPP